MYRIAVLMAGLGTRERVKYNERELSKPKEKEEAGIEVCKNKNNRNAE